MSKKITYTTNILSFLILLDLLLAYAIYDIISPWLAGFVPFYDILYFIYTIRLINDQLDASANVVFWEKLL